MNEKKMINEAIKHVIKKTGFTQRELAEVVGATSQQQVGASLCRANFTTDKAIKYLEALGYELVVKPINSKHFEDEIILKGSKEE